MNIFPLTLIPNNTRIDFMRMRWVSLGIATLLFIASIATIAINGWNRFNVAFKTTVKDYQSPHTPKA